MFSAYSEVIALSISLLFSKSQGAFTPDMWMVVCPKFTVRVSGALWSSGEAGEIKPGERWVPQIYMLMSRTGCSSSAAMKRGRYNQQHDSQCPSGKNSPGTHEKLIYFCHWDEMQSSHLNNTALQWAAFPENTLLGMFPSLQLSSPISYPGLAFPYSHQHTY